MQQCFGGGTVAESAKILTISAAETKLKFDPSNLRSITEIKV